MDSHDEASSIHFCMALNPDETLLFAIEILQFALDAFDEAEKLTKAMGAAAIRILNAAQKVVDGIAEEIKGLEKSMEKQNKICSKECTMKIKAWKPKIYWKPGGCYKLIFKRIKACLEMVFIGIAIVIANVLIAVANIWLQVCRRAMEVLLKIIEAIMKAAKLLVTLAMQALKVIQLALFFLLNMLRRSDDMRPAIKCDGINIKRFKQGFDKMDLLRISEMVIHMKAGPRNITLATSFTKRFNFLR